MKTWIDRYSARLSLLHTTLNVTFLFMALSVTATTYTWTGAIDNLWNNPGNWTVPGPNPGIPGFADDVEFDASAATVNINCHATCHDITWNNGSSGTLTGSSTFSLTVTGSMDLGTGMSVAFTGPIRFESQSGTQTIKALAQTFQSDIYFDHPDGDWEVLNDFNSNEEVYLVRGSLSLVNCDLFLCKRFDSDNSNTRELDITNAFIYITSNTSANGRYSWDIQDNTGLTFTATNSIIRFTNGGFLASSGLNYHEIAFQNPDATSTIVGSSNFFHIVDFAGNGVLYDDQEFYGLNFNAGKIYTLHKGLTLTINDHFNSPGSCNSLITLKSSHPGHNALIDITGASPILEIKYTIIEDVNVSPTVYSPEGGNIFNLTSETGYDASTAATPGPSPLYWIGTSSSDWSDQANWDGAGCTPDPYTDVIFDPTYGWTNDPGIVDISNAVCHDMTWVNNSNPSVTFSQTSANNSLTLYGSLALESTADMTWSFTGSTVFKSHAAGETIHSAGQTFNGPVFFEGAGGGWTLDDDFESVSSMLIYAGDFDSDSYSITANHFYSNIHNEREIYLNNSEVTLSGVWDIYDQNELLGAANSLLTFNAGNSHIHMLNGRFGGQDAYGNNYNDVSMENANGSTQSVDGDNTFNHLAFLGNGTIRGDNDIASTLTFSEGKNYNISGTQTTVAFHALGTCNGWIRIKNGTIECSGTVTAEYLIIKNNAGVNAGAAFYADNSIKTGNTADWTVDPPPADDYYFKVGSNMNWNDPNNWYLNSGLSVPSGCTPGPLNDVYFIGGSFTGGLPSVTIDASNAYCDTMFWDNSSFGSYASYPIVTTSHTNNVLRVFGGMYMEPTTDMDWNFNGLVHFEPIDTGLSGPHEIDLNGQTMVKSVYFDGSELSEWISLNDFQTSIGSPGMELVQGNLQASGIYIRSGHISAVPANAFDLNISNSTVSLSTQNATHHAWFSNANLSLVANSSTLILDNANSGGNAYLTANTATFHDVQFVADGTGLITGLDNTFHNVEFQRNGAIGCDNNYTGELRFTPGYIYTLTESTTQSLTASADLAISGTLGNTVFIKSTIPGSQASFAKPEGEICLNFVSFKDNEIYDNLTPFNNTYFFAGQNSFNVQGNSGWAFTACEPTELDGCVDECLLFESLFNGNFDWDFGDGSTGADTAEAQPCHDYAETGTYDVQVEVSNLTTSDLQYFIVNIHAACCDAASDSQYVHVGDTINLSEAWPNKVYVSNDVVVIGATLDVTNSDVVLADGAGIYLMDGAIISATNSTFRPCNIEASWTGFVFDETSAGEMNECAIISAEEGVSLTTTGLVELSNNQFLNNEKGVFIGNSGSRDHVITGNTFIVNADNPFTNGSTQEDFYGIQNSGVTLTSVVSQNDFIYSSSTTNVDIVYGIHNNDGVMVSSENTFTNVTFAYVQIGATGSAFENNNIDFNQSAAELYTNASELVAVTIDGDEEGPTLIANNRINMSIELTDASYGVYGDASNNLLIHNNRVNGFENGIRMLSSSGQISANQIDDSDIGIYVYQSGGAVSITIKENEINRSSEIGLYIESSNDNVYVWRNTIKNDFLETASVGVHYEDLTASESTVNVEFIENCVFDTRFAMIFISNAEECVNVPYIRGNYLYNYSDGGMDFYKYEGDVGTGSDYGRNSFVANNFTAFDVQSTGCVISAEYNWPDPLVTAGEASSGGDARNSHSACGNQAIEESERLGFLTASIMEEYVTSHLPLTLEQDAYHLSGNYKASLASMSQHERQVKVSTTLSLLLFENNIGEAKQLLSSVASENWLTTNELSVLWYNFHYQTDNLDEAAGILESIKLSSHEVDLIRWKSIADIRVHLLSADLSLKDLSEGHLAQLQSIDSERASYSAEARDMIHIAQGEHAYIYDKREPSAIDAAKHPHSTSGLDAPISLYPNPTSDAFVLNYAFENDDEDAELIIHNAFGQVMLSDQLTNDRGVLTISVESFTSGVYMISINQSGKTIETLRLIKQ